MYPLLILQYESIKSARQVLLDYYSTINTDLFKKIDIFNNNCIRDLLVHNANTYISWLDNFGLDGTQIFYNNSDINTLNDIKRIYEKADLLVVKFLERYRNDYTQSLTKYIVRRGITVTATPLQLFTHVITHEFHHKGQILTMSRVLGYIPVDADVIRF